MGILNYTTTIDFEKTISEIRHILTKHGATKIISDYEDTIPVAMTFHLILNGKVAAFALPCNYIGVLHAMEKDKSVPRAKCTKEQALRVSWRIIKDWIAAQMALIEAQLAEMAEVFLPYAVTKDGQTLYKAIQKTDILQLE